MIISKSAPEGNIFAVMEIASQMLGEQGRRDEVVVMIADVTRQRGYEMALKMVQQYVPEISFID